MLFRSVEALIASSPEMAARIHPAHPYTAAEVVWAVREEMARTVEDVLSRRVRLLFVDAAAAIEAAPEVARLIAQELGCDKAWEAAQIEKFSYIANNYCMNPAPKKAAAVPEKTTPESVVA